MCTSTTLGYNRCIVRHATCAILVSLLIGCDPAEEADAGRTDAGELDAGADASEDASEGDAGFPRLGDSCGDPLDANATGTVDADGILRVRGSNFGGRDDHEFCDRFVVGTHVADIVYRYTAPAAGRLRWTLDWFGDPTRFDVDVRTTCDDVATSLECQRCDRGCDQSGREVESGQVLYFIVAGVLTTGNPEGLGEFDLAFDLTPYLLTGEDCDPSSRLLTCAPGLECQDEGGASSACGVCGDGFRGFGLFRCDDGNMTPGDGCSDTCEPDNQPPGGADCASPTLLALVSLDFGGGADLLYAISSGAVVAGSDVGATCAAGDGPEAVYSFALTGTADVAVSATGADAVTLRSAGAGCGGAEVGCLAGTAAGVMLSAPGLAAGSYLLIVDRNASTSAPDASYSVELTALPL